MAESVTTVWMVSARTGMDGWKGVLELREGALVFRPESTRHSEATFRMTNISRVRRARGSPVLEIHVDIPDHPTVVGFYFVKPPPMRLPDTRFRLFPRYLARRAAVHDLWTGNAARGAEVTQWVKRIERQLKS